MFDWKDKLLWVVERLLSYIGQGDPIKEYRERRKHAFRNSEYFQEISSFFTPRIHNTLKEVESTEPFSRASAYSLWVDNQDFPQLTPIQKNSLILLALCNKYEQTRDPTTYSEIRMYTETLNLNFTVISDGTRYFLNAYHSFFKKKEKHDLSEVTQIRLEEAQYRELLKDFADEYDRELFFQYITQKLAQSEQLRETLVYLIKDGRLATYGLNKQTLERLESELRAQVNYSKTFVVIANKLDKQIQAYIQQQPGFTGFAPKARNIPGKKGHQFSVYIFRPTEGFKDGNELLRKFKLLAQDKKQETMVAVFPLDSIHSSYFTFPANQSFKRATLKTAYEIASYFKTGAQYSDSDFWNTLIQSEIPTNELLAIIPFNVLVPGILPSERGFIITNYREIQKKMDVTTLTDWGDKQPTLLKQALLSFGTPNYTAEERSVIGKKDRMLEISKDIIDNSKKLKDSLGLLK